MEILPNSANDICKQTRSFQIAGHHQGIIDSAKGPKVDN